MPYNCCGPDDYTAVHRSTRCARRSKMIWGKRRDIIVRDRLLFNAEPPGSALASAEITALDAFCSRNYGPIPDIARDEWRLTVDGMVANPLTLTCDELAHRVHRI